MDNDLISMAAAIDAIVSLTAFINEDDIKKFVEEKACDDYYLGGICDAIDEIKNIAAVDAAPVRHGRWIEDRTHIMCSVCGARYKDEIVFMPDACMSGQIYDGLERCPHCGARMDGGELNDT